VMLALLPTMLSGQVMELTLEPIVGGRVMLEPPMGQSALGELLAAMKKQLNDRPAPKPLNPCSADIRRLQCTDAACLKRSAETLEPQCAAFLLGMVEPSPAPAPVVRQAVHRSAPQTSGYFTVMSSGSDGHVQRISGPVDMGRATHIPDAIMMPGLGSMLSMLPPELASMVQSTMALGEELEEQEEEEEAEAPQHPCAREVNACVRETGCNSRSAIEGCLVKHFTQLSTECKCFVHHITNGRVSAPTPAAAVSAPRLAPHAVPVIIATVASASHEPVQEVIIADVTAPHPVHRLSCLFVFTGLFLLSFFVVRAIITLLCCRGRARTIVVVPPEEARIKAVGAPPLLVSELTTKPVQVAEPLAKA